jgi:hypothetical protein
MGKMPETLRKPFEELWITLPWLARVLTSKMLAQAIFIAGATAGFKHAQNELLEVVNKEETKANS